MKKKRCFLLVALLLSLLATVSALHAEEVTATAELNVQRFPVDRMAQLTVSVQGVAASSIEMPDVEGLDFHPRGQSVRREYVNGTYSASVSSMYLVEASRSGTFTIPPIMIHSKEGTVETAAITFEVAAAASGGGGQPSGQQGGASSATRLRSGDAEEVAFMRVEPARKKSYSGEVVPVQIKVYIREGIKANLNSLPQLQGEGFVLQQLEREPRRAQELIGNSRYSVLIWNSALSGIKEGAHSISIEVDATLLLRQQRQRAQQPRGGFVDPFFDDSFFNSFFSSYREKEVKVASPKLEMRVESLPVEGKPDTFSGAIGDFRLRVEADPLEISKGDPVTLTMTVSGVGNFDRVQAPQVEEKKGWKAYSPSSEFLTDGSENRGRKVFEQALVAKGNNLQEIPGVTFSYFDSASGGYKTLRSAPIPLKMRGAENEEEDSVVAQQEASPVAAAVPNSVQEEVEQNIPGLAPLQLDGGKMNKRLEPLFMKRWFQILCAVLLCSVCLVLILKFRAVRLANNPLLQRQKDMDRLRVQRERDIEERLVAGDSRGFLAVCRSTIQEQLGLLWGMEAAAITHADLKKRMSADSVLPPLFNAADESAYGGQELSAEQMQEFAQGLKKELEKL